MRLLLTICASVLLLAAGSQPAFAQNRALPKQAKQKWAGPKSTPRQQLEQLMQMPPEERERYLAQLPPMRRAQLEELAKLPPEQLAIRLRRLDIMNSLTPQRRLAVKQEITNINGMTFPQRRARMHSKEFEESYSADELELLRERFPGAAK